MVKESRLVFKVKGWLEEEEFKELLKIARYLGRKGRESLFELNLDAILSKGLSTDEVIDALENVNAEYNDELIAYLEERLQNRGTVQILYENEELVLKFSTYLGELFSKLKDIIRYRRDLKLFTAKPYRYWELIQRLNSLGFKIIDETGIKSSIPLNHDITFKGVLRDYQEEALRNWISNNYKGVIALPTGSGKTVIAIAAIAKLGERTLVIAYTKEQLMQWRSALVRFTNIPEYMVGLYYSGEKRLAPITLTTYQTAYKYIGKFAREFSLLIIDEVHHLPAEKFRFIAESTPIAKRMGLSATPYREDGKHVELFPLMGGIVYYKSPQELAEKGYLAQYKIITVRVQLKPEERRKLTELRRKYRDLVGFSRFEEVLEAAKRGDEKAIEALRIHNEISKIVHKSSAKVDKVEEIVRKELSSGRKIIVFAHYVDLAEEIARRVGGYLLIGEMPSERRKRILEAFRRSRSGVLVVTTLGDEGLDIPDASVGVLVAGTGSRRQFIQRLGRLLRPSGDKVAILYEVITKGTVEELQAKKRKELGMDEFFAEEGMQ